MIVATVTTRDPDTFDRLARDPGSLAGDWQPWTRRGTVTFASPAAAQRAIAEAGGRGPGLTGAWTGA